MRWIRHRGRADGQTPSASGALGVLRRRPGLTIGLLLGLVGIEVVTVAGVILSQWLRASAALEEQSAQMVRDVIEETRESTRGFLVEAEHGVQVARGLLAAGVLSRSEPEALERYFYEQLEVSRQLDGMYVGWPDGDFLFTKRIRSERYPEARYLTKRIFHEPRGEDGARPVRVVERVWRGPGLAELGRERVEGDRYDPRARPWYRSAVRAGRVIWTEPYVFFTSRAPGITVAAPYRRGGSEGAARGRAPAGPGLGPAGESPPGMPVDGVVGADVELGAISRFLARQDITREGNAVILTREGAVVAHPRPESLPRPARDNGVRLVRMHELDAVSAAAWQKGGLRVVEQERSGGSAGAAFERFTHDGTTYVGMFLPFLDQARWPWLMGVYAPERLFIGTLQTGQRQGILLAVAVSLVITGLSFFLGTRLLRPVRALERQANHDPMTGLLNRRGFTARAGPAVEEARRTGQALTAIMLDIDHFKAINDGHGHAVGDEVLNEIAERARRGLAPDDLVARHGGEEFAILLRADLSRAAHVAERLRAIMSETPVATSVGAVPVTVSLGVATLQATGGQLESLLDAADQCMLIAKRKGRNRVQVGAHPIRSGEGRRSDPQA